ncbi:MAG TPA: hypothetical protein VM187_04225, partial [Niastella sp.]|nr:hypothetical protein [Niastella sp.]
NISMFGAIYLYGYKSYPQLALWLCGCTCLAMIILSFFSGAWLIASMILSMAYLFVLKKPGQQPAFEQLYAVNEIYSTQRFSQTVLDKVGNRNWRYAEGKAINAVGDKITYSFWQGSTSSTVSSGKYARATVFNYYLLFIFPPGSVSNTFKQKAMSAADKSHYTLKQKLKYFFKIDTETPIMVTTVSDGSFILQYNTVPDAECYARRFNWIRENLANTYRPVIDSSFSPN